MPNPEVLIGMACTGNGDCVALVQNKLEILGQQYPGLPHTSLWREGPAVKGNTSLAIGTVVATFEKGRYINDPGRSHAAYYAGQNDKGIFVVEEFKQLKKQGKPIQKRFIEFNDKKSPSNNGNRFSVLYTVNQ